MFRSVVMAGLGPAIHDFDAPPPSMQGGAARSRGFPALAGHYGVRQRVMFNARWYKALARWVGRRLKAAEECGTDTDGTGGYVRCASPSHSAPRISSSRDAVRSNAFAPSPRS